MRLVLAFIEQARLATRDDAVHRPGEQKLLGTLGVVAETHGPHQEVERANAEEAQCECVEVLLHPRRESTIDRLCPGAIETDSNEADSRHCGTACRKANRRPASRELLRTRAAPRRSGDAPEDVEGVVDRIVFANPDNGWTVLRLTVRGKGEMTAVGHLASAQPGETLKLRGRWVKDRKYGRQFRVESFETARPATYIGIERYLSSGLIQGIGKTMAKRLVHEFGLDTLDVIENEPEKLQTVDGIGAVRSARIREAWKAQRDVRDIMVFLQSHGVGTAYATKIQKRYGEEALRVVRETPHRLAQDVYGIGFKTADRIARDVGVLHDAPERLRAGLLHALRDGRDRGHVFQWRLDLVLQANDLLDVPDGAIPEDQLLDALGDLTAQGEITTVDARDWQMRRGPQVPRDDVAVYLKQVERAESHVADALRHLTGQTELPLRLDVEKALDWYQGFARIELAPSQREALRKALLTKVLVITGGPGTGKTTLVRGLVEILRRKHQRIALTAPTGRAAKRLGDATGMEAKTLHRLLEFQPETRTFARGPSQPLAADLVVVDEASMLDTSLASSLLWAVPEEARLVLVGDVDQLPSIGPGRVLADIIESEEVETVRLTEIFRQARSSLIVVNAHRVRDGLVPHGGAEPDVTYDGPSETARAVRRRHQDGRKREPDADFFFIEREEPEAILSTVEHLVAERIPSSFGFDPKTEIQILTPMRRGLLGTGQLNAELQALLNPDGETVSRGGQVLRVGDRVMQRRNNYDLGVFNGDVGHIVGFDLQEQRASVDLDGRMVIYPFSDLDELTLAYACSIHKSQGSEYPCVVLPLHTQHWVLLQRNLLYTAITRGKQLVVIVGSRRALVQATRHQTTHRRRTLLVERLRRKGLT